MEAWTSSFSFPISSTPFSLHVFLPYSSPIQQGPPQPFPSMGLRSTVYNKLPQRVWGPGQSPADQCSVGVSACRGVLPRLSLSTDGDKGAMVNFFFLGGGWTKSYLSMYLLYIVFLSFFSKKISRSLRSLDCVLSSTYKWKHAMCLTNPIYIFFHFFGVIIADCQLPKFTENTHKIALRIKCPEIVCGGGVVGRGAEGWRKGGKTWEWGRAPWLLGG